MSDQLLRGKQVFDFCEKKIEENLHFWLQIPFPAVTICPESKTSSKRFNVTEILFKHHRNESLSDHEKLGLESISQVCEFSFNSSASSHDYVKKLREVQNNFSKRSFAAFASEGSFPMKNVFDETITAHGVCYSFNMLNNSELFTNLMNPQLRLPVHKKTSKWNKFGYRYGAGELAYPLRVPGAGIKSGLSIFLMMEKRDVDYACSGVNGWRLTLHTPDETAQPQMHLFHVPFDSATLIQVKPKVMSTEESLNGYSADQRQCYVENEKKLKFHRHYTQSNCQLECLTGKFLLCWLFFLQFSCYCYRFGT